MNEWVVLALYAFVGLPWVCDLVSDIIEKIRDRKA